MALRKQSSHTFVVVWGFYDFSCLVVCLKATQLKGSDDTHMILNIHATQRGFGYETTHLDKRVDYTNIGTGIEDFAEPCLSVDQLQLVELLVVL